MFKKIKNLTFNSAFVLLILVLSTTTVSASNIQDTGLEAYFDNTMKSKMEEYHIPNATVSVVKDGEVVYKKGFGLADI